MAEDMRIYYVWLALTFGPASRLAAGLLDAVKSPKLIFENKLEGVLPTDKISEKDIERAKTIVETHKLEEAAQMMERCFASGIDIITPASSLYPIQLFGLSDFPMAMYVRGTFPDCNSNLATAVVGTRKMTDYGRNMAYSIGVGLAYGGAIVVSGMALGSDSMALIGALDSGGCVVAVLGSGVDVVYPREHRDIYRKIIENGAVISEYPPGTPPIGSHFPVRNRIMSGIADATVVIEADANSGALITASRAFDQGKKVFAVPGKIGEPGAEGTNNLLHEGAIAVVTAEDILTEYEFIYPHSVSVQRAHTLLHGKNMEELSRTAMARSRINSKTDNGSLGSANYYGSGSYGGRRSDYNEKGRPVSQTNRDKVPQKKNVGEVAKTVPEPVNSDVIKAGVDTKNKNRASKPINVVKSFFGLEKDKKSDKNENLRDNSEEKIIPAKKIELDMLDEKEIKVYNKMKPGVPMLPDELIEGDMNIGAVLGALTMLEMAGAVESGSGGYFMRVQPDDIMQSEND